MTASSGPHVEVRDGGAHTTVQDLPGRLGYWHVGVPPSGPMDDVSHRLVNLVVGNPPDAAALELTGRGPTLRFPEGAIVAVGGAAMPMRVDGRRVPAWAPVPVPPGGVVEIGAVVGPGLRATFAVRGALDVEPYLGSRSTFVDGGLGGHLGRALRAGDVLPVGSCEPCGAPRTPPAGLAPTFTDRWELGVLVGPHAAPDFLTDDGLRELLRTPWEVHFNSARTGVRLIGPRPLWTRADGGEAGLHPSNIHDTGYAIGAVDLTGDMPIILGRDGPSLGGFVCPAVVATAEQWKLGQLRPGDTVRLVPWSLPEATAAARAQREWVGRASERIEPVARPSWNRPASRRPPDGGDPILARREPEGAHAGVTYRRAGDRFVLVEYGPMALDLGLRLRVHALAGWVGEHLGPGCVDATAGVRSLLVQVDGDRLAVDTALARLVEAEDELRDLEATPFPSRVVHLPLSWDDPATREAIERYMHGVRADAPWCPSNIEFIRRMNGLDGEADVRAIVFGARYLVLGLGDVYLGAPVATPLDPRHRLVTTKYNPARTWTPENAVGIGGAYLCIYGMEGPGGYQFVGRTVPVWNRDRRGPHFAQPWLLRDFDQICFEPVGADDLLELRDAQRRGELELRIDDATFTLADQRRFEADHAGSIDAFQVRQRAAFAAERQAWTAAGEHGPR